MAQRTTLSPGAHVLGRESLGATTRVIYVPYGVDPAQALPFAVMMHGGGDSMRMDFTLPLAEDYGVVLLLPQSRKGVWDAVVGEFEGGHEVPDAIAREAFAWLS